MEGFGFMNKDTWKMWCDIFISKADQDLEYFTNLRNEKLKELNPEFCGCSESLVMCGGKNVDIFGKQIEKCKIKELMGIAFEKDHPDKRIYKFLYSKYEEALRECIQVERNCVKMGIIPQEDYLQNQKRNRRDKKLVKEFCDTAYGDERIYED